MRLIAALVCGLLLIATPLPAAPLTAVESTLEEKEQLIRVQAQGPLPYEVEQKTPTRLVVFLPRAQIGTAPVFLSLPTGDLSFEENSVGLRLRLENITGPVKIAAGKRPGSLEIRIALQTAEEKPAVSLPQQPAAIKPAPTTFNLNQPEAANQARFGVSRPIEQTGTANPAIPSTSNTPKVGDISDETEEDPDPPRPGITPVSPRPLPQP